MIVEDEPSMREFLEILLRRNHYDVTMTSNGSEGCQTLDDNEFDIVITDLKMPKVNGLEVLAHTKKRHPQTEVILMTAFATTETALSAMRQGAYDYLTKPFKVDEVLVTIERAMEKHALVRDNVALREQLSANYRLESIIGRSQEIQQVFDLIRRVAPTKTNVLITGESGTGKELVARAIHNLSNRNKHPFVAVNCGAIPDALMESELFGHAKGAFTGASSDKEGLFSAADGGTIFLDEIAELSLPLQVKLLRTLQERKIKPVGDVAERAVDVRILAATNKNLAEEVDANRFRQDLFYRLNVIPVQLPPLRERVQDIPLLAHHFMKKYAAEMSRPIREIAPKTLARLSRYHYPGNVRELENLIERAVTLSSGEDLEVDALPELNTVREHAPIPNSNDEAIESLTLPDPFDLDAHLATIERGYLLKALKQTSGNRTDAARLLGMNLRSIRYRLQKHQIDDESED